MNMEKRTICFSMVFMMLSAVATVSIGYTNFVQAEIKEDIIEIKSDELIDREKISSIQVGQAEIKGDIKLILALIEKDPPN
jgi:hypothetical protein